MKKIIVVFVCFILLIACESNNAGEPAISKVALGSCILQTKPAPIFTEINKYKPDVFAFLGDNVYGDTLDMNVLKKKYDMLGAKPGYQLLQKQSDVIATWDDHDYGRNDAGVEYPKKAESQKVFLDFYKEPKDSIRRKRKGIYTSYYYGPVGKRVQIILLDNRYHRTKLKRGKRKYKNSGGHYQIITDPKATMLGKEQWEWLEEELKKEATIRFIAGGTQFLTDHTGFEAWANFPKELEKITSLIIKTKANGVIFLSGDTHWTEISKRNVDGGYPLYDYTSSGLTQVYKNIPKNKYRLEGKASAGANFGAIDIDWDKKDPVIALKSIGVDGNIKISHKILLSELQFK